MCCYVDIGVENDIREQARNRAVVVSTTFWGTPPGPPNFLKTTVPPGRTILMVSGCAFNRLLISVLRLDETWWYLQSTFNESLNSTFRMLCTSSFGVWRCDWSSTNHFLIWINLGKAQHQCTVSALHFPAVPFTEQEGDGVNKPGPPNVRDSWLVLITHPWLMRYRFI